MMFSRMLSTLTQVRVTVSYAAVLAAVATTLLIMGPRVEAVVVSQLSTNLHNLARGHFVTLVGSVFVTSDGFIYVWLPGLVCLLALAELLWRGRRLILVFGLGHLGATLIVALGLTAAIRFGWLPISVAHASDVGISYGAVAIVGALTAAIPGRWRGAWVGWWLAVGVLSVSVGGDFTNTGHLVALMIGMVLSARFPSTPRWTSAQLVLLVIGVAFAYLVLAHSELPLVAAPIAGLVGAMTGHCIRRCRRGHRLHRSNPSRQHCNDCVSQISTTGEAPPGPRRRQSDGRNMGPKPADQLVEHVRLDLLDPA